jgi:hypothetical protein
MFLNFTIEFVNFALFRFVQEAISHEGRKTLSYSFGSVVDDTNLLEQSHSCKVYSWAEMKKKSVFNGI